jgi:hypothetical protein
MLREKKSKEVREMKARVDQRAKAKGTRTWVDTKSLQTAMTNMDTMYGRFVDEVLNDFGMQTSY